MGQFANARFAAGYLIGLMPPLLLVLGHLAGIPWLAFAVLVAGSPFLRLVFGDAGPTRLLLDERTATCLHYLPHLIALAYIASFIAAVFLVPSQDLNAMTLLWYGLSQWSVSVYCSCVAHELLHRRNPGARLLGRVLSGLIFYPPLEHEHRMHHLREGDVVQAEWPAREETVWTFSARRAWCALRSAWQSDRAAAAVSGRRWSSGLPLSCAVAAGYLGLLLTETGSAAVLLAYLLASLVLIWSLHAMTYIQHWGLGSAAMQGRVASWEDTCRAQAWLTLNLSFHHSHHLRPGLPYYRVSPTLGAPHPPAGYVVLFFCALSPRAWFALMSPVLDAWLADPGNQVSVGRRLVCFGRSGITQPR